MSVLKQFKLDQEYATIMQNHPFGIALYRPLRSSTFKPGAVGYFDDFGSWNPICHLEDNELILDKGLSPIEDSLEKAPPEEGIIWGPKTSGDTKATKIEVSAGVDPATGIPITVSSVYAYSTDHDVGGVLLTSPPITQQRYYHASPFKKWVKQNALKIIQRWPEVQDHGVWIVSSTHATKKCAINMWKSRGRGFKVGFSVDAMGAGGAGAGGEWYRSQTDEGWGEYTAGGTDQYVVFFGGLKFQYTRKLISGKTLSRTSPVLRGDPIGEPSGENEGPSEIILTVFDPDNEADELQVDCEEYLAEEEEIVEEEW